MPGDFLQLIMATSTVLLVFLYFFLIIFMVLCRLLSVRFGINVVSALVSVIALLLLQHKCLLLFSGCSNVRAVVVLVVL